MQLQRCQAADRLGCAYGSLKTLATVVQQSCDHVASPVLQIGCEAVRSVALCSGSAWFEADLSRRQLSDRSSRSCVMTVTRKRPLADSTQARPQHAMLRGACMSQPTEALLEFRKAQPLPLVAICATSRKVHLLRRLRRRPRHRPRMQKPAKRGRYEARTIGPGHSTTASSELFNSACAVPRCACSFISPTGQDCTLTASRRA